MPQVAQAAHRHPYEVMVFIAFIITGTTYLTGVSEPRSVVLLLPKVIVYGWYILILASGVTGVISVLWRDLITALLIERVAVVFLGPAALIFATALLAIAGMQGFGYAMVTGSVGIASVVRAVQINRDLRRLAAVLRETSDGLP